MNLAGTLGQSCLRLDQRLIFLVLDVDQLQGLLQYDIIVRNHNGNLVSPVTDILGQQQTVFHILMGRVQ